MRTDSIPVAAGEPARKMIQAWAESHGMTLYQGREGTKFPVRRLRRFTSDPWAELEYVPWSGTGPAIAQIHRYIAILDADDSEARERVASMDLPPHFATRGVSYSKQVVTEHHYLSNFEGCKRILPLCPGLDFLANPDEAELWIKLWDEGYEVISTQPDFRVPALPGHLISLHRQAEEEQRQRSVADGDGVPVEKYRAEGIIPGQQSIELFRSACNLAARRVQPDEILTILTEIVEHSELTRGPWHEHQLASMADRGYRRYGKPPIVVRQLEMEDPDPSLYPGGEDEAQDQDQGPGQARDQGQDPEPKPEDLSRHVRAPRLRVDPPAELAEAANRVIKSILTQVWKVTYAARPADPGAEDAQWGDMSAAMSMVEVAAEVLGGLGDLDLVDYQRADAILRASVLPKEYTRTLKGGMDDALARVFGTNFRDGWNAGAAAGFEVPDELQGALDAWHPPCPLPREDIEEHRLPGRPGRWPVQNFVAQIDDRGNARRLLDHYGDRILFVDGQKGLGEYAFDGQRWLDVEGGGPGLVAEFADRVIQALPVTEAMSLSVEVEVMNEDDSPESERSRYWKWLNMQQSGARRAGMIASAVPIPGMRVPTSVFDANARWLNVSNGELDLGRVEVGDDGKWRIAEPIVFHPGQHYPEHRHSRITVAAYDPEAVCPEWEKALKAWLGDDDVIAYLGKLVAASVRGMTTLKVIVTLIGRGDSGKSTFLEVIMAVLGSYATTAAPSVLRKGKGGGTLSDDVAELRGFRFVSTTETAGAEEMDEPRIKRLSGGDRQRARGLYQSSAEFDVQFLLWFATNAMPRLSGDDFALWGRFATITFPGMWTESGLTPAGEQCGIVDPNLKVNLLAEAPGILAWIIRHLKLLYTEGLNEPKAVTDKRHELQSQADTPGQWLAVVEDASEEGSDWAPIIKGDDLRIHFTRAYKHYSAWASGWDIKPVGRDPFRASMENHGIKTVTTGNRPALLTLGHQAGRASICGLCGEVLKE